MGHPYNFIGELQDKSDGERCWEVCACRTGVRGENSIERTVVRYDTALAGWFNQMAALAKRGL